VPAKKDTPVPVPAGHQLLGSREYINQIQGIASVNGYRAALDTLMKDVDKYGKELDHNSYTNIVNFYRLTSYLIEKNGYVDMKIHYFRNKLNRAPGSLKELLRLNSTLPPQRRWRLIPVIDSLYHMQGANGAYNMKFVSGDGFCEAVYNKEGVLLTEKNDPVNMGTFNYAAGIHEASAHLKYDITPYWQWGNTPDSPQKGKGTIEKGSASAYAHYLLHAAAVDHYRNSILRVQEPHFPA